MEQSDVELTRIFRYFILALSALSSVTLAIILYLMSANGFYAHLGAHVKIEVFFLFSLGTVALLFAATDLRYVLVKIKTFRQPQRLRQAD